LIRQFWEEFTASVLRVTTCFATYCRENPENFCAIDLQQQQQQQQQQQDRKFAYNVRLRRVRKTIVAVESNNSYSECVFVVLCMKQAMRMLQIVICGLSSSTIFFHIIS